VRYDRLKAFVSHLDAGEPLFISGIGWLLPILQRIPQLPLAEKGLYCLDTLR
jgi:hypothetical protein